MAITKAQEFTASGTFNVPTGVSLVHVTIIGAGGGAGGQNSTPGQGTPGGGSGGYYIEMPMLVTAGGTCAVTIGSKGLGGVAAPGSDGGDSSFVGATMTLIAPGGKGATGTVSGAGGGALGGAAVANGPGSTHNGITGATNPKPFTGGSSGGGGGSASNGNPGGASINFAGGDAGLATNGGGGGGSTPWGKGGAGSAVIGATGGSAASTSYGAGGGGARGPGSGTSNGGDGCDGYCLVVWMEG